MGEGGELGGHPHLHPLQNQRPSSEALEPHLPAILHSETGGVLRGHVDVPLGGNQSPIQPQHPVAVAQGNAGGALNVPRQPYRGRDAQHHAVGEGDLHLALLPLGAQHHHVGNGPFGALQSDPLGAYELPRLGQVLHTSELEAGAEEGIQISPGQVDVAAAGLHLHRQTADDLFRQGLNIDGIKRVHIVPPLA